MWIYATLAPAALRSPLLATWMPTRTRDTRAAAGGRGQLNTQSTEGWIFSGPSKALALLVTEGDRQPARLGPDEERFPSKQNEWLWATTWADQH